MSGTYKTSVTLPPGLLTRATERMTRLRFRYFSTYVCELIESDLQRPNGHKIRHRGREDRGWIKKPLSIAGIDKERIDDRIKALGYLGLSHYVFGLIQIDLERRGSVVTDSISFAAETPPPYRAKRSST